MRCCADLRDVVDEATEAFEAYDYTTALEVTEKFFWDFCDDYLELVKERARGEDAGGRRRPRPRSCWRCRCSCGCSRRSCPYVTEEVWSWWQEGSIHRAAWPSATLEITTTPHDPALLVAAGQMLAGIRGAKSTAKVSQRTAVTGLVVRGSEQRLEIVKRALNDVRAAGNITGEVEFVVDPSQQGGDIAVEAQLAEPEPKKPVDDVPAPKPAESVAE